MTYSKSAVPEDFEGRLAALRAEFPGWTVECAGTSPLYRAVRSSGEGERLGAGSYSGLRRLLYEADTADCERALLALSKELEARGASAIRHSVSIVTRTRTGTARTVGASRRRFIWDSGLDLGPLDAVEEVAVKIVRLLGLVPHPQLAALARRMGVRGYRVDIGAPEITVTADGGGRRAPCGSPARRGPPTRTASGSGRTGAIRSPRPWTSAARRSCSSGC